MSDVNGMNDKIAIKRLTRVFIAARTNFFVDVDEHVTLAYFQNCSMETLVCTAYQLRKQVPTQIRLSGFANWQSVNGRFYEVALVNDFNVPLLFKHTRTPHVTICESHRPVSNATFEPYVFGESQDIDSLWVGKSSKGKIVWMPIENEPIMDTANRSWEIFGGL